jgi:thioredoxin 1
MPIELDTNNFRDTVDNNDIIIIDFWAPWCGPCKSFAPVFEKVAGENTDITFAKVNTEEQQELAAMFNIRSIPTLMVFREKVIVYAEAGALPEQSLNQLVEGVKSLDMAEVHQQVTAQQEGQQPA